MQDFTIYHVLATVACIALFVWLRIRLFGKLNNPAADASVHFNAPAPFAPSGADQAGVAQAASSESTAQQPHISP